MLRINREIYLNQLVNKQNNGLQGTGRVVNNVFNTSFSYENLLALNQATHEELKAKE